MRLKFLTIPCILFLAITVIVAGCAKDGDTGPAGPAGATGPAGPTGATGTAGPAGTANVIYSAWIDTTTFTPIIPTPLDTVGYFGLISAPKLDLDMLNKGEIKVYVNANTAADPVVFPLPYNDGSLFIDVVFYLNTIQLTSNGDLTGIPFRYVLIPGGTAGRSAAGGKTVDWNNYKEVQQYLGLKD